MRVFITGVDGYLGWSLACHLATRGHEVAGVDNFSRRAWVDEMGSQSATPILEMADRLKVFRQQFGKSLIFLKGNLVDSNFVANTLKLFRPEAIVHLGEMPSAPYSMIDARHAIFTHENNLHGTLNILFGMRDICPYAHLVKLGTMGEYGTPDIDIPEGFFTIEYRGRITTLPFPRQAGSWYHQTKVHDSNNIMMACRLWKLSSTDIMQGVVYGTRIDAFEDNDRILTRFDFDQSFGTAINRYCAQAVIGQPLTLYGKGRQKRGFLPLKDSMQCLTLAIENPPEKGQYRVFNQFEEVYDVSELAQKVAQAGNQLGLDTVINHIENPRYEAEDHYYNPDHKHLLNLGYQPTHDMHGELRIIFQDLMKFRERIETHRAALSPDITWAGERRSMKILSTEETQEVPISDMIWALERKSAGVAG